jgi:hypothetical protein
MRTLFGLFFAVILAAAQPPTLTIGCPSSASSHTGLVCQVTISNSHGAACAYQFTATSKPTLGGMTVTPVGSAVVAAKVAASSNNLVLIGGMGSATVARNANSIPDGAIASLAFAVPAILVGQTVNLTLAGGTLPPMGTTAAGLGITVTAGRSASIHIRR